MGGYLFGSVSAFDLFILAAVVGLSCAFAVWLLFVWWVWMFLTGGSRCVNYLSVGCLGLLGWWFGCVWAGVLFDFVV